MPPTSRTVPAMAPVEVAVPAWPGLDRARRRVDTVRSCTGRVATIAGGALAAVGMFTGELYGACLLGTAAATLAGLASLRLWKPDGHQKATATALYLMPGAGLAALLVAEQAVAGIHWGEALALGTWTTATWVLRPGRTARRMRAPLLPPPAAAVVVPARVVEEHPAAWWWARHVAVDDGAAPGTLLQDIEQTGESAMRAVIRSAVAGRPVPDISIRALSALMDVPEDQIGIGPVPGRGASMRRLTIGTPDMHADPATVWAQQIAPTAMPGAVLTSVRIGRPAHTPEAGQ
ncbi:hypothetical protein ABZU32_35700 [Sphaerisporangium sp. NPDC005288]|uniref:hypothetical protein n=1 Tax=Sphaerisporangium sp. NPDC005288 TaxID=3155114 RepID=UPI0033B8CF7E